MFTKISRAFVFVVSLILLSGCSHTGQLNTVKDHAPSSAEGAKLEQLTTPEVKEDAEVAMHRKAIDAKLKGLGLRQLSSISDFIDASTEAEALGKRLVTIAVEAEFPFFAEGVLRSNPLLNTLPRDKGRLHVMKSKKVPNAQIVYYEVRAEDQKGQDATHLWMPAPEAWAQQNTVAGSDEKPLSPRQVFWLLFYEGNGDNVDLITPVKKEGWKWSKLPFLKNTRSKRMLIPLATLTGATGSLLK